MKALEKVFSKKNSLLWVLSQCRKISLSLLLLVLLGVATTLCGVALVISSKTVIDTAVSGERGGLLYKCLGMAAIIALNLLLQALTNMLSTKTTLRFEAHLKERLFEKVLRKEWLSAARFHSGDLVARFTSDISVVANGITGIVPAVFSLFIQLIASLYVLFVLDSTFAFLALVLGPSAVLFGRYYGRKSKRFHTVCQETEALSRSYLQEALQSLVLIKAFSTEKRAADGFKNALDKSVGAQIKRNTFSILAGMGLTLGYWLGYLLAIGWGAYRLSTGHIGFGTMTAFVQLIGQVQAPFTGLAKTVSKMFSVIASSERLIELEKLPDESEGCESAEADTMEVEKLVIEGVGFSYGEGGAILEDVNIEFRRGEFVIIAGPSGEGKTTLLRMLLGLVSPISGEIYLAGKNGERLSVGSGTRKYLTYVPQGNLIMSGTIAENIKYGNPGASEAEMVECAKAACIYDFISEQPQGFNTLIGERGLGLSEGQAQRIAIARALLNRAPILLFDEATSALDPNLEKNILENLKGYAKDKILIFVSHRRSIDMICNRAIILENGAFKETAPDSRTRAQAIESIKLPANIVFQRLQTKN